MDDQTPTPQTPLKRGGRRDGSGRPSATGETGVSAVLRARTGQQRIDKLARIAAARGTTPAEMLRVWIDRMKDTATEGGL
jgi:hypothetical protein